MSEFKYGDMVEVRDLESQKWKEPRFYLGSLPFPNGKVRHYTMGIAQNESNFSGYVYTWNYLRMSEPNHQRAELTIDELEAIWKSNLTSNNDA